MRYELKRELLQNVTGTAITSSRVIWSGSSRYELGEGIID